jgi:EAL and modified HD-GYP domain-containing signal transduction protein
MGVFGYQVLHRESDPERQGYDAITALLQAKPHVFAGDKKILIEVGPKAIESTFFEKLPHEQVIPILNPHLYEQMDGLHAVGRLKTLGFKFGITGLELSKPIPAGYEHAKYINIGVKEDIGAVSRDAVFRLKHPGRRAIAIGVSNHAVLQRCWTIGFEYFQGQFIDEPVVVPGRALPQNRAVLFNLLSKLQDENVKIDALDSLVASDVVLSYRLLKLVNSASFGLDEPIDSIRQSLMLLGVKRVASLVSMLAMSGVKDKPQELAMIGMIRGKLCELLAGEMKFGQEDRYFTMGLLSVLPALFDMPIVQILEQLPISSDMATALADHEANTPMARVLKTVMAYEEGYWEDVDEMGTLPETLVNLYVESIGWATEALKSVG